MDLNTLLTRAQKELTGVHPFIAEKALQLVTKAHAEKIYIIITQGLRTIEEQNALYAKGRTAPGKKITNAKGGYSMHNFSLAFDFCVVDDKGKPCWNVDKRWHRVGAIGKSLGLEWGGDWTKFKDYPHFQYTFGLSLADLRAGKKPPQSPVKQVGAVKNFMEQGDKGSNVEQVQQKLIQLGYLNGNADGDFGPLTLAAVKQFQTACGLSVDGVVGPATLSKLNEEVIKMSNAQKEHKDELAEAVAWAKEKGISNGERLNEPATRAQVLLMLYRALK
jgi:peptidoglycan LD-endopeptidase CwlK